MDLSTGKNIDEIRKTIIEASPVPIGTVPIYQMLEELGGDIEDMRPQHFLDMVEHQAKQGVDYMTVHCGVLLEHLHLTVDRVTGIVSRGGSLIAKWMMAHRKQNPLYTNFRRPLRHHARVRCDVEPGRRHASRLDRRRQRRGSIRGA
jgi:phosphomethylpyrimidine synthase